MSTNTSNPASSALHRTACPLDCPDSCSLEVRLENGRVTKLDGDRRNPVTAGYICSKVRRFDQHVYGEARLRSPMRRVGAKGSGRFEEISWDEALDTVAGRLLEVRAAHGGEAILPFSYGGSNGYLTQDTLDARLFRRLGASRLARTVCAAATTAAITGLYGKMPGVAYEDYPEAKLVVVWGANPSASGIHLVPFILEARRRGAKLVVVDPRRTQLAKQADLHLALRPGTDLPLALAVIHWLFEEGRADTDFLDAHATGTDGLRRRAAEWSLERAAEVCGLDAEDLLAFARLYADTSPAVIRCGWGQERNRNGGSATAAILALPAVAGKLGVRGGGYTASNSGAWKLSTESVIDEPPKETRRINMNRLGRELLGGEPQVHLLFVYNANPLATLPRQDLVERGLRREDLFTVVFEQVMTDTARFADILLPATTFLEHRELRKAYGAYIFQDIRPAIAPVGEARSNPEVFEALLERTRLARPADLPGDRLAFELLRRDGLETEQRRQVEKEGLCEPTFGRRPVQGVDVVPGTADGKIHLVPESLERQAPKGLYVYQEEDGVCQQAAEAPARDASGAAEGNGAAPLTLISPATNKTISSTLGQLRPAAGQSGAAALDIHPEDAARRGISGGDVVRISNAFGEVLCPVRVTEDVRPGVVSLAKGLWSHETLNGATGNVLAPDTYTDLGEGACFNDARVEVEKAPDEAL